MVITKELKKILDIGILVTSEKSYAKLLETIIREAMSITNCDAGTLYILKDEKLHFMIMRNHTMGTFLGGEGEEINMPPVVMREENVCSYVAIHKTPINVKDVYSDEGEFDWQGPKKYDSITGYHTQSMLVIPLVNHEEEVLGVLQLINAKDESGKVIEFDESFELIVYSLASQASISLSNMILVEDLKKLMDSFVSSMTTAIDSRTPYNANHSVNVAKYCEGLVDYINKKHEEGVIDFCITPENREQLILAARLHDVGKMITPLSVMNKAQRVGENLPYMEKHWSYIAKALRVRFLEGGISEEEYEAQIAKLSEAKETVYAANTAGFLQDELYARVLELEKLEFETEEGTKEPFVTKEQFEGLCVRKGTLTAEERKIIEDHVVYTSKILSKIEFGKKYDQVQHIAECHHEFLNGTGYPFRYKEEDLSTEIRILTIMDVFDSLTSSDRPYKTLIPVPKALGILESMVGEGKLDEKLVSITRNYVEEELQAKMEAETKRKAEALKEA